MSNGLTDWICSNCGATNDRSIQTDKCWKCGCEKSKETACWICRRTESEILKQAEADGMGEYVGYPGDKVHFTEITGIYEGKFKKDICPVCYWVFIKMTHQGIKEMIEQDAFTLNIDREYP